MAISTEPLPPPPEIDELPIADPPPPYPTRERRTRISRSLRGQQHGTQTSQHTQSSSGETDDSGISPYPEDEAEPNETTPFLTSGHRQTNYVHVRRQRAQSITSTMSAAPSLAQTVLSLFQTEDDVYLDEVGVERVRTLSGEDTGSILSQRQGGFFWYATWKRYFRPMAVKAYWRSLFHLTVINFPYGLLAWVYLFVFTVVRLLCNMESRP